MEIRRRQRLRAKIVAKIRMPLIRRRKAAFRGRSDILFTFIPTFGVGWGFEDVTVFRNEEGRGCIRRAESAEQRDISRH